jgi:hypothetical protein
MPFLVQIDHDQPWLTAQVSGPATLADLCGAADLIATVARLKGYRRALIDMLAMQPHLSFTDHLQLGTYVAAALDDLERVATVVTEAVRSGASEKAAQKSGLGLRAFVDGEEARRWLAGT